ncbi:hypothetical protein INT43_001726 [Umbelopsis isabellina]|uniref:Uncharacterized protein n=1 Tax=Mortierella isabellina TaxID=91625 RepID=A0A8H7UDF4_MORIS|nr:hypothetical protein INT43_001726 [Umbelopsis isabellina]
MPFDEIPELIPAGLLASSFLKATATNDQQSDIVASTSRQLSREKTTEQSHGSSHSSQTSLGRDSSRRLSRDNIETSQSSADRHKNNYDSTSHSGSASGSDSGKETRIDAEMLLQDPMKSQDQIRKMLLKLEKLRIRHERYTYKAAQTAKAIHKTSRNLERTMRIMTDVTFAKYHNLRSSSNRPPQNELTEEPAQKSQKRDRPEAEPLNVKIDNYNRKPRSLLYNIAPTSCSYLYKFLVSTTMNGDIHTTNCETRKMITTVPQTDLLISSWAEDICWATPQTLAVAVHYRRSHSDEKQLCLVNIKDNGQYEASVQAFAHKPHATRVNVIAHVQHSEHSESSDGKISSTLVTGGLDSPLMLWKLTTTYGQTKFLEPADSLLGSKHTSHVLAVSYDAKARRIYSGGADCKLAWTSLDATTSATGNCHFGDRINHILTNQVNPHLLMICLAGVKDQMRLYDVRMQPNSATVLILGCSERVHTSRFIRPAWRPNSRIVASGNMSGNKIYIF